MNTPSIANFSELPQEVLERILDYVTVPQWVKLRKTCSRMKRICIAKMEHEFKRTMIHLTNVHPNGFKLAKMKVLFHMCQIYLKAGLESLFYESILKLNDSDTELFALPLLKVKPMLINFYNLVAKKVDKRTNDLLYLLTLLHILRKCKNAEIVSMQSLHSTEWKIVLELKEFWFGILSFQRSLGDNSACMNKYDILVILFEVLLTDYNANTSGLSTNVWEQPQKIILCGRNNKRRKSAKVNYYMNINGTKTLIDYVKQFYYANNVNDMDFKLMQIQDFDMNMAVKCHEAVSFGCGCEFSFDIGVSYLNNN